MASGKYQAIEKRRRARRLLLQNLYRWQLNGEAVHEIINQQFADPHRGEIDQPYLEEALRAIINNYAALDGQLQPFAKRPIAQLDPVERAVLWIAAYELSTRHDIPERVVINEAIELAKSFGAQDSYKFINGLLDKFRESKPTPPVQVISEDLDS